MSATADKSSLNTDLGPAPRNSGSAPKDVQFSFEFFPPKSEKMENTLWDSIQKLEGLNPDFVSVTYGAGGSTRERTHRTVVKMANETQLKPAAHLTCVGSPIAEIEEIARDYWENGVRHIVALRGDPPEGIGEQYTPTPGGYAHSNDLVAGLKSIADFEISVSAYPERHPESPDWGTEIDNLKRKVDAGATRAITQFFYEPDTYLRYLDRVRGAGIDIPIVPGLMLQPNFKGLQRMSDMCGVRVPDWYAQLFEGLEDDAATRQALTASLASELSAQLLDRGVRQFHLYTLNRAELALVVSRVLGVKATRRRQAS